MDLLFRFSNPEYDSNDQETEKFLNHVSCAINKKIANLEQTYNICIRLSKLPERSVNTSITMPINTNIELVGNLTGSIPFNTSINITPELIFGPYLIDPLGQYSLNNRAYTIKKYLEIIKKIKSELEEYSQGTKTKEQIKSEYFRFK